tara:strand:+ start:251 stop:580 length:330 start_codon:yes stop_codon:yes gene_type:complete
MIECEWCGAHTQTIENENGEVVCGRCKRPLYEKTKQQQKTTATMQTPEYREKMKNKRLYRTQGWPDREPDSKIDPELSWKRLLNGKKYNDPHLYPGYVYRTKWIPNTSN